MHNAGERRTAGYNVVQGDKGINLLFPSPQFGLEHRTHFQPVPSLNEEAERVIDLFGCYLRQEAYPAKVDADQRHMQRSRDARGS
jgi:hypothetical protein